MNVGVNNNSDKKSSFQKTTYIYIYKAMFAKTNNQKQQLENCNLEQKIRYNQSIRSLIPRTTTENPPGSFMIRKVGTFELRRFGFGRALHVLIAPRPSKMIRKCLF